MDVLLLGAAAIVLIALTLWIVWRPPQMTQALDVDAAAQMPPSGDRFEDQYTSATADLSAGGIAVATVHPEMAAAELATPTAYQTAGEPWSEPTLARERTVEVSRQEAQPSGPRPRPQAIGIGAAALLTLGGAVGGAWLYSRWQQQRKRPVNRLRRIFR